MRKSRGLRLVLMISLILSFLTACSSKAPTGSEQPVTAQGEVAKEATSEKKTFGYITPGPDTWYQRNVDGFQMAAKEAGYEVIVLNSDYDVNKEISNIESMISQGVDGFCIFSFNENGAIIAAEKAAAAGIPIVVTDSCGSVLEGKSDVVAAIDFDWEAMGTDYANWLAENAQGEKYAIITGNFESVPCQMINESMKKKTEELGKNTLLEIRAGEYNPSVAVDVAQDLISSGLDFTTMFVMNEDMAAAIIRMLEEKSLLNNPYKVISQNGSPAGLPLIKTGKLEYTISSSPGWEGLISFLALDNYVTGKNKEVNQSILLPIMPVDQNNIDDPKKVVPWEVDDIYWDLTEEYFSELLK